MYTTPRNYRRWVKQEGSAEKVHNIEVGFRRVKLAGRKERLALVKGLGREPLIILTNLEAVKSRKSAMFVVLSYFRRWQIEEGRGAPEATPTQGVAGDLCDE